MQVCAGTTKLGADCRAVPMKGTQYCRSHTKLNRCGGTTLAGKRCKLPAQSGFSTCKMHRTERPPQVPTYTVTFCDQAEGCASAQHSVTYLRRLQRMLPNSELVDLSYMEEDACLLVVRGYLDVSTSESVEVELGKLDWDKKFLGGSKVMNRRARWTLTLADESQEPCYEEGKGRVVSWKDVPVLSSLKDSLVEKFDCNVVAECNNYYEEKCGIGYHADKNRTYVIGLRVGRSMPLCFRWYLCDIHVGETVEVMLNAGDLYVMSSRAVNSNGVSEDLILKHAAGDRKYIDPAEVVKK